MLYTTLNEIKTHDIYSEKEFNIFVSLLNKEEPDNELLSIETILYRVGIDDAVYLLRIFDGIDDLCRLFAIRCARQCYQHLITDCRSIAALDVAENHAIGLASNEELREAEHEAIDVYLKHPKIHYSYNNYIANLVAAGICNESSPIAAFLAVIHLTGEEVPIIEKDFKDIFCKVRKNA